MACPKPNHGHVRSFNKLDQNPTRIVLPTARADLENDNWTRLRTQKNYPGNTECAFQKR